MSLRHAGREVDGGANLTKQRNRAPAQIEMAIAQDEHRQGQRPLLLERHGLLDSIESVELGGCEAKRGGNDIRTERDHRSMEKDRARRLSANLASRRLTQKGSRVCDCGISRTDQLRDNRGLRGMFRHTTRVRSA